MGKHVAGGLIAVSGPERAEEPLMFLQANLLTPWD